MPVSLFAWSLLFACSRPVPPPVAAAPPPAWLGQRSGDGSLPAVLAVVNGETITAEALVAADDGELLAAEAALAQARRDALDQLVLETIVHQRATAAGLPDDEWIRREVAGRYAPVTDADVDAFYEQNADQIAQPLEEIRASLKAYLDEQRATPAIGALLGELRRSAAVEDHLPRYRVAVDGQGAPRIGSPDAPVQIVEFSDFQCPYCARASQVVREVLTRYGDQVSLTYRHFPLDFHPQAHRAAQAAACAGEQDQFWAFHDELFADASRWTDGVFDTVAEAAKVNPRALRECLDSGRHAATVDADLERGRRVGTNGTPAFFVNGIPMSGAQPFEAFAALVDAELARR